MKEGANPDKIMEGIKDIVIKTMTVGQPFINHIYRSCQPEDLDNSMCFQILGFDIMIDRKFKPWLIEVNQSPSFKTESPLDYDVKKAVLRDAFSLLNINQEKRAELILQKRMAAAQRMLTGKTDKMDPEAKKKLREERLEERFEFERQQLRCGSSNGFELIYPSTFNEEVNPKYDFLLKKANEIWDEFTTGKNKKKVEEPKPEVKPRKRNKAMDEKIRANRLAKDNKLKE